MKRNGILIKYLISFCVITTGVSLLEGVLGSVFYPQMRFGFAAYFVPPLYGLLTCLTGLVLETERPVSQLNMVIRMIIQLALIEGIVFGTNFMAGNKYTTLEWTVIAAATALVFALVHLLLWLNERRTAARFNERLEAFQKSYQDNSEGSDRPGE